MKLRWGFWWYSQPADWCWGRTHWTNYLGEQIIWSFGPIEHSRFVRPTLASPPRLTGHKAGQQQPEGLPEYDGHEAGAPDLRLVHARLNASPAELWAVLHGRRES